MDQLQGHNQQKMRAAPAAPRRYDGQAGNPLYDPANGGHYGEFTTPRGALAQQRASVALQVHQADSLQALLLLYVNIHAPAPRMP